MNVWNPLAACATLALCATAALGAPAIEVSPEGGAAQFREGLWMQPDPDCRFDAAQPVTRWPRCAHWGVIRDSAWLYYAPEGWSDLFLPPPAKGRTWGRAPFALPPGKRRILQLKTDPFGEAGYQFLEVRVDRLGPDQRITAFTMGFPAAGRPFAWKPAKASASGFDPFPDAEAAACAAVTDSCESGEPYLDFNLVWARDPRPDDFARR